MAVVAVRFGAVVPQIVWVLPSTRTWTVAANAAAGRTSERTMSATRRLATNPPSARGSLVEGRPGRSSDSGLPLPPPSRGSAPSADFPVALGGERLPLQRRDRPGLTPGSLSARPFAARV